MITIICIAIFIVFSLWLLYMLYKDSVTVKLPREKNFAISCTGPEAAVIAMFATGWIGLSPVISIRLGFLELLCLLGFIRCRNKIIYSGPLKLYTAFLLWVIIGIFYSTSLNFGLRMTLKYLYPFLLCLLCSKVVNDGNTFITAGLWGRFVGTIGIILLFIPFVSSLVSSLLWYVAAFITGLISFIIFSFALADFGVNKKNNIWWGILLCFPCIIAVFRTDIFGTAVAMSFFFLIKYKLKAVPVIAFIGTLGLFSMFYIPSIKNKMFIEPEKVTLTDFISGEVNEDDVQTNMRKFMWEDATERFYDGNKLIGSGTGRVQTFFYTEATDARRGGQLHNDFLVLCCDNGQIGFWLFILSYVAIFVHCMKLYYRSPNPYSQMAALVAGTSIMGVFVTMFSDNTLSYSMVTLSYPWGFYGMALGMQDNTD